MMGCGTCGQDVVDCKCEDLNQRMRDASDSDYVIMRWCKKCDSYYLRCSCPEPEWVARTGGKLEPLPKGY